MNQLSIHDNVYDPEARISLLSIHDNVYDPEARISLCVCLCVCVCVPIFTVRSRCNSWNRILNDQMAAQAAPSQASVLVPDRSWTPE